MYYLYLEQELAVALSLISQDYSWRLTPTYLYIYVHFLLLDSSISCGYHVYTWSPFFNRSRIKTLHIYRSTLFLWGFWRYSDFLECETSLRKQRYIDFHWNKLNLELNKFVITGLLAKKISMVYLKFQILLPEQNVILIKTRLFNKPKEDNTLLKDAQLNFFARFLYRDKKEYQAQVVRK